jgi:FG-GAP-like repeat
MYLCRNLPLFLAITGALGLGLPAANAQFGSVTVNQKSASVGVTTLSNQSSLNSLTFSLSLGGANPGDFQLSGGTGKNCSLTSQILEPGSSCTLYLIFAPSSAGSKKASVIYTEGVYPFTSSDKADLTGTGVATTGGGGGTGGGGTGGGGGTVFVPTQLAILLPSQNALRVITPASKGTGTFADAGFEKGSLDPAFIYWASQPGVNVVGADFRASGYTDIAVFGGPCPGLYIEANNGNGTFTLRTNNVPQFIAEAQLPGSKFLVGDFNGDGLKDLAVIGTDRSLTFSLSNRDATSRQATASLDPTFSYWASLPGVQLIAADFRGSGFSDLAVFGGPCPGLYVEASNGNGTYTLRANNVPQFIAEAQLPGSKFLVGDFNGDGLKDLASSAQTEASPSP